MQAVYCVPVASLSHFFTKLFLAAPASFFSVACTSHAALASVSHFFIKLFLAAPESSYITGTVLTVDGGYTAK